MPDTTDAYTHRIGRTGRAEKTGGAFSLVTHEDEAMVRSIEHVLGTRLERRRLNGFDYQRPVPPARGNSGPRQRQVARGRSERVRIFNDRTFTAGSKKGLVFEGVPQAADPQPFFGSRNRRSRLPQHRFRRIA